MYPDEILGQAIGVLIALYVLYRAYRGMLKDRKRRREEPYKYRDMGPRERKEEEK